MTKTKSVNKPDPTVILINDRSIAEYATSPVCSFCSRLRDGVTRTCDAFINIPDSIWSGKIKHKEPYVGDNGLMFVEITKKDIEAKILSTKKISESFKTL